ncbi:MAG: hypothetical protein R3Y59_10285 [bacterium]
MTLLEFINKVLFQWLCVRLCNIDGEYLGLLGFVYPGSGWTDNYKVIGKASNKYWVVKLLKMKNYEQ